MKLFAVALMFLTSVILIVSLVYIVMNTRHKEKMALIEKGLDPKKFLNDHFMPNTLRAGMLLVGTGVGFLVALLMDEYVLTSVDSPCNLWRVYSTVWRSWVANILYDKPKKTQKLNLIL